MISLCIEENNISQDLIYDLFFIWRQTQNTINTYGVPSTKYDFVSYTPTKLPYYFDQISNAFDKLEKQNIVILYQNFKKLCLIINKKNNQELTKHFNVDTTFYIVELSEGDMKEAAISLQEQYDCYVFCLEQKSQ